jgi:hypothetical protein
MRRAASPVTVVMKLRPCTTKFPIGLDLMGSTVNGPVGRTIQSAFPARHTQCQALADVV